MGGGEMKKDVQEKTFPGMVQRIAACQLDWLLTSASQRIKRGLIHMTTPFPFFLFAASSFVSSSLPV